MNPYSSSKTEKWLIHKTRSKKFYRAIKEKIGKELIKEMHRISEVWKPYRSEASRYIWRWKEDIKKNTEDLNEVKTNYIDRFEKIRDKQNESVMTLMQKLHETEMRIVNEIAKFKNNDTSNH